MADEAIEVVLFTDGACSGNPGPGGWAYILRHPGSGMESRDSGNEPVSTNNRMELTAAVRGAGGGAPGVRAASTSPQCGPLRRTMARAATPGGVESA